MMRSKFTREQVAYALRQEERGTPVPDVCRQLGVSEATSHVWKMKFAHLGVSELRRIRQLHFLPRLTARREYHSPSSP